MGIDAEMFVKTTHASTQEELEQWRCKIGDAFGPDSFYIKPKYPALRVVTTVSQDSNEEPEILPKPGEYFIQVSLATRYYGVGYERGNFPLLYCIARWLEINIPEAVVYYGGDSSGVLFRPFDKQYREALMEHFLRYGHYPYREYFDPQEGPKKLRNAPHESRPVCPSLDCGPRSLAQTGFGRDYTGLYCVACGLDVWTRDSGATWQAGKQSLMDPDNDQVIFQMTNGVDWELGESRQKS